jgi:hypothetical protein
MTLCFSGAPHFTRNPQANPARQAGLGATGGAQPADFRQTAAKSYLARCLAR